MRYVYHGSHVSNLKLIKRHKSTHKQNWVYASYSEVIATIFLNKNGSDLYYFLAGNGSSDNPIVLVERKEGMFKKIFNTDGSIYKLSCKNFLENQTGWSSEVVSNCDEEVISERHIDNVYEELLKLSYQNKIQLYLYPERPSNVPIDNSDLIPKVIRWHKNGLNIDEFFLLYPELSDRYYDELSRC